MMCGFCGENKHLVQVKIGIPPKQETIRVCRECAAGIERRRHSLS